MEDSSRSSGLNTKKNSPRYAGEGKTVACVFSHRVSGAQNDPARIAGIFNAVSEFNFKKMFIVTTELLNEYTLFSEGANKGEIRVKALQYLIEFLKNNTKNILALKVEFDFLPFYQVRYSYPQGFPSIRELFVSSTGEKYTEERVAKNIEIFERDMSLILVSPELKESAKYRNNFKKNVGRYNDGEDKYRPEIDKIAKLHKNDDSSRSEEDNTAASRNYQFGEGVLNQHLAGINKAKVKPQEERDCATYDKEFDALLYSGGPISASLQQIERRIRSEYRLDKVVYDNGIIEYAPGSSPKTRSHSDHKSTSEESSASEDDSASSGKKSRFEDTESSVTSSSLSGSPENDVSPLSVSPPGNNQSDKLAALPGDPHNRESVWPRAVPAKPIPIQKSPSEKPNGKKNSPTNGHGKFDRPPPSLPVDDNDKFAGLLERMKPSIVNLAGEGLTIELSLKSATTGDERVARVEGSKFLQKK